MAMAVGVLVVGVILVCVALLISGARRGFQALLRPTVNPAGQAPHRSFGALPTPADPVGELGALSPDANLGSPGMAEHDLLGE